MKKLLALLVIITVFYGCKNSSLSSTSDISENENQNETSTSLSENDTYAPNPEGVELTQNELDMIIAVNKYRERNGRRILKISKRLMDGAREQSKRMKLQGQHHWLYSQNGANAENIFVMPRDVQTAMYGNSYGTKGFTQSAGHNANILNASFQYIGVGNIPDYAYGCWTQRFSY